MHFIILNHEQNSFMWKDFVLVSNFNQSNYSFLHHVKQINPSACQPTCQRCGSQSQSQPEWTGALPNAISDKWEQAPTLPHMRRDMPILTFLCHCRISIRIKTPIRWWWEKNEKFRGKPSVQLSSNILPFRVPSWNPSTPRRKTQEYEPHFYLS